MPAAPVVVPGPSVVTEVERARGAVDGEKVVAVEVEVKTTHGSTGLPHVAHPRRVQTGQDPLDQ